MVDAGVMVMFDDGSVGDSVWQVVIVLTPSVLTVHITLCVASNITEVIHGRDSPIVEVVVA